MMLLSDVIVFVLFELLTCVVMDAVSGCDECFLEAGLTLKDVQICLAELLVSEIF